MTQWWDSLSTLQRIYGFVALPATFILVIQSILVLFGIGHHDTDASGMHDGMHGMHDVHDVQDAGHDGTHDGAHDGFALFSIRGLVAFFSVGGWTGIVLEEAGLHPVLTMLVSLVAGMAALYVVALLFRMAARLQSSGNIELKNAVGKNAKVYIPIPAGGHGTGKVMLTLQERYVECDALTYADRTLKTGEQVRVAAIADESTLLVEPLSMGQSLPG